MRGRDSSRRPVTVALNLWDQLFPVRKSSARLALGETPV